MLVGGVIVFVIRIPAPFTSLCQKIARCLPQAHCLCSEKKRRCLPQAHCLCSEKNVVIGFKISIEAYFVGKTAIGRRSGLRLANYSITFERNVFTKIAFFKSFLYCDEFVGISLL